MKKLAILAMVGALAFAAHANAESKQENQQEIQADKGAIHKDNAAIGDHEARMEKRRASKAAAKARGDKVQQAKDSVAIGGHKTAIAEKKMERKADRKILKKDRHDASRMDGQHTNPSSESHYSQDESASAPMYSSSRIAQQVTHKDGPAARP